jgi:hypothetical protein
MFSSRIRISHLLVVLIISITVIGCDAGKHQPENAAVIDERSARSISDLAKEQTNEVKNICTSEQNKPSSDNFCDTARLQAQTPITFQLDSAAIPSLPSTSEAAMVPELTDEQLLCDPADDDDVGSASSARREVCKKRNADQPTDNAS